MPRFGNNIVQSGAPSAGKRTSAHNAVRQDVHNWQDGSGRWRLQWAFSCELDLTAGRQPAVSPASRDRGGDELGALLDRALAFAG